MSVWRDKKGRYHVGVQCGGTRIHRICPETATWRDAKRRESEIRRGFDSVATGQVLIGDAIQRWLKEEVAHHKARRRTESNAYALADWVQGRYLTEIHRVANEYQAAHRGRLTNSTINRRTDVLKRVANLSYKRWGWLDEPLGMKIESLPENPPRLRFFSRDELAVMLRRIPQRNRRRAALVGAFTGIRRSQVANLRPIQVQSDLIYLKTSKAGQPLMVPIVHHIAFALKRLPFGVHPDTLTHDVAKAMPGDRFHDLRRTAGSMLLQAGVDIVVVSRILGHKDIRTTLRIYAHLLVGNLRAGMAKLGKSAQTLHTENPAKSANG